MLDELAARKLRFHQPDLARQWDAIQQEQRKADFQKLQSGQTVNFDLGRKRSQTTPHMYSVRRALESIPTTTQGLTFRLRLELISG